MFDETLEVSPFPSPTVSPAATGDPEETEASLNSAEIDPVIIDLIVNQVLSELEEEEATPIPVEVTNLETVNLDSELNSLSFAAVSICICLFLVFFAIGWRFASHE